MGLIMEAATEKHGTQTRRAGQRSGNPRVTPEERRRRCHDMVDKLTDPALIERARRFLTYLYVYREADEKTAPRVRTSESGKMEKPKQ